MDNFIPSSTRPKSSNFYNESAAKFDKKKARQTIIFKKFFKPQYLIGSFILLLLIVGGVSAFILSQTNQDVRQQASGCVYWNGDPAPDKAYDNRGGIRQQCINGLWDFPDDGNTDPSELIAEQQAKEAAKPKAGCVSWNGSDVKHGAYDNRGGIRQQCVNGLWDVPDDGNLDPSEIIAEQNANKPKVGCVSWDGTEVKDGAYEDRGGIRQQCTNGLWDTPDDGITDPRGGVDQISSAIGGLDEGTVEYTDARETYDKFCRNNIESQSVKDVCDALDDSLRAEEQAIRYEALNNAVKSNTDTVSTALGHLEEGQINYAEAKKVYDSYCNVDTAGSNYNSTSRSVCDNLEASLQEEIAEAATVAIGLITTGVEEVSNRISYAIDAMKNGIMELDSAQEVLDESCEGNVPSSLKASCAELAELTCGGFNQPPCTSVSGYQTCDDPYKLNEAGSDCVLPGSETECGGYSQQPCTNRGRATCNNQYVLNQAGDRCILYNEPGGCGGHDQPPCEVYGERECNFPLQVNKSGNNCVFPEDLSCHDGTGERGCNIESQRCVNGDLVYESSCQTEAARLLRLQNEANLQLQTDCECSDGYGGNMSVGDTVSGHDDLCYQCYPVADGGCRTFSRCGYSTVTHIDSIEESALVDLQNEYPDTLFLVDNLTSLDQIQPLSYTLNLMPDSLISGRGGETVTYLIGDEGTGGGLSGGEIIQIGSPGDAAFHQNPDVQHGYASGIIVHETLHSNMHTVSCGTYDSGCATYLEIFEEVAEADGYVFETEYSDMTVDNSGGDFLLYTQYPTTSVEGFAITGAAYMLAPDQLREERPQLYEFYRDVVYEGVEYIEIYNNDCSSTHIEVRSSSSESLQQRMGDYCN